MQTYVLSHLQPFSSFDKISMSLSDVQHECNIIVQTCIFTDNVLLLLNGQLKVIIVLFALNMDIGLKNISLIN